MRRVAGLLLIVGLAGIAAPVVSQTEVALQPHGPTLDGPTYPQTYTPLPPLYRRLRDPAGCRFLSFSPDGALLASTNERDEVGIFDTSAADVVWVWRSPEYLATSLGPLVWPAAPVADPAWDTGTWSYPEAPGWPGGYRAIFGPTDQMLAVAHNPSLSHTHVIVAKDSRLKLAPGFWLTGGYVHLFGDPEFEYKLTIETERPQHITPLRGTLFAGLPCVSAVDFSPLGKYVATGSSQGMLRLWEPIPDRPTAWVRAEDGPRGERSILWLDFSPAGDRIATIGSSGSVRLWSVPELRLCGELSGHAAPGYWVEFSPDGRHAASSSEDGTLRTWDLATGAPLRVVDWHKTVAPCPVFRYSADGSTILFGATGKMGVVGALDPAAGVVTGVWPIGLSTVKAFAISPNGELMAAGDREGNILIWRMLVP